MHSTQQVEGLKPVLLAPWARSPGRPRVLALPSLEGNVHWTRGQRMRSGDCVAELTHFIACDVFERE